MTIYGVDRKFRLTVGAYRKISESLPGGDMNKLGDLLGNDDPFVIMNTVFRLACIMNERYERQQAFLDPDFRKHRRLTVEELETLSIQDVVGPLKDEVVAAIIDSQKTEINIKNPPEAEEEPSISQ